MAGHGRQIAASPGSRPPVPDGTWNFSSFLSWRSAVWRLMDDVLDERVRAKFLRAPPRCIASDYLDWLDDIVFRSTGRTVDTKTLTAERLVRRYTALRACHATSTMDVDAYYRDGILPLDPAVIHRKAEAVFLGGAFPELSKADLDRTIAALGHGTRAGNVFFDANEMSLIEDSGHYLLYGSEYLLAIAANLPRHRDYRMVLKRRSTPTMFVCDVPLSHIPAGTVLEFAGTALQFIFEELLHGDGYQPEPHWGGGFRVATRLDPENIVGHYYPEKINDPFL